jgi:molecular chaperone GrpE
MTNPENTNAQVAPEISSEKEAPVASAAGAPANGTEATANQDANQNAESNEVEVLEPEIIEDAAEEAQSDSEIVAAAKAEAAEWQDKYVRLHAEWDTYRRRTKEQQKEEKARAAEKLVCSLLPIIDDLERTIDYAEKNGESGLLGGVQAVLNKFVDTLKKDGVEVIDPAGEAFDALESQAVGTVDDPTQPDETVAQVYQKGYRLSTKVLRPAMVTVTTGGPKRKKPAEE